MNFGWMVLAPALAFAEVRIPVEAVDGKVPVEATPEVFALQAHACRADLKDYALQPTRALVDRLLACMNHPDMSLRDQVVDEIPNTKLWQLPDFRSQIEPALWELSRKLERDPAWRHNVHASQLRSFLVNTRWWFERQSAEAKERRSVERRHRDNVLGPLFLMALASGMSGLLALFSGLGRRRSKRR